MSIEKKDIMPEIAGKTVFFAKVSDKMKTYKEILVKELENNGSVIKQQSFAEGEIDSIRQVIEQCEVAIHILSDQDFGINSSGKGLEELQINCSVQHYLSHKLLSDNSESDFKIYVWHQKSSSESIFEEERVAAHLKKIQQLEEVEFLRTNFEEFKYYLIKKIENNSTDELDEFYIKGNDNICIYLQHDRVDKVNAQEYIDYLNNRGFTVFSPEFDSDILTLRQMHTNFLKKFDVAIIYAKEASTNWINMKIMDILKSPGLGREKDIVGKAVFVPDQKKESLTMIGRGFELVSIETGTAKSQLDEFLQKLSS